MSVAAWGLDWQVTISPAGGHSEPNFSVPWECRVPISLAAGLLAAMTAWAGLVIVHRLGGFFQAFCEQVRNGPDPIKTEKNAVVR